MHMTDDTAYRRLYALAVHLLTPRYRTWRDSLKAEPGPELRLLPARIPDDLPIDMPVPDGAQIIGSVVVPSRVDIFLDTDLSPDALAAFYRAQLTSQGWTEPKASMVRVSSDVSPLLSGLRTVFCQSKHGPFLSISAYRPKEGTTQVGLFLNTNPKLRGSPCSEEGRLELEPGRRRRFRNPIPTLYPPPGSRHEIESSCASHSSLNDSAELLADLDLPAVSKQYNHQLEHAGWVGLDRGVSGPIAWSAWQFETKLFRKGHARLYIRKDLHSDDLYLLHFSARWSPAEWFPLNKLECSFFEDEED